MAKTVIGEHGFYKLDHPCFREVYETTYIEDVITDIHLGPDDSNSLLNLPNTCEVEDSGVLPVFYNCKRDCYTDKTGLPIGNALVDGVKAFEVGESVKVLCEQGEPKYVIGHASHEPRMCADIFKMYFYGHNRTDYYIYYIGSTGKEFCELNTADICEDIYGYPMNLRCTEQGHILFGQREFTRGSMMHYWGDIFVKVGPIMYILRIESASLFPAPLTTDIVVFGAIWTEELEAECNRLGGQQEHTIPGATFTHFPIWPVYPSEVKRQEIFTQTFRDRFWASWSKMPAPRWIYTKLYGER